MTGGIGSQAHNYGVLLLVSVGDRKARIELGAAWAGTKDDTTLMIMQDIMVPNFKKGDYSSGILQGVEALDTMARGNTVRKPVSRAPWLMVLGLIALGVGVGVSLIRSGHAGWGWAGQ
ncbi:MAG TPA: TPM domain-containing protein [Candidatus Acidoferrum sp.]|nr:TPM domain-containing protein [Candidatus Acidoferrum sp.]